MALRRAFEVSLPLPKPKTAEVNWDDPEEQEKWQRVWESSVPVAGTRGDKYLQSRGLCVETASASGVRFCVSWHGRATVVFPLLNLDGDAVAIAGRCVYSGDIDKPSLGPKKQGAFFAKAGRFSPLDRRVPRILICEAPLDALSVASAGYPALALCGTTAPEWLATACAFQCVLLATDADAAGDESAVKLAQSLASFGASCTRLRPQGAKDWNQMLQEQGRDALADWLAPRMLL